MVSRAASACPGLTLDQILWETPMATVSWLAAQYAKMNGAEIERKKNFSKALKGLKARTNATQ